MVSKIGIVPILRRTKQLKCVVFNYKKKYIMSIEPLNLVQATTTIYDRIVQASVDKYSVEAIKRAYKFEVSKNLAYLHLLKFEEGKTTLSKLEELFPSIVKNLDITIACLILFNGTTNEWKKVNKEFQKIKINPPVYKDAENIQEADEKDADSIFKYIMFTVRKITILQQIASYPDLYTVLPNLQIKTRLERIKENFSAISQALKEAK